METLAYLYLAASYELPTTVKINQVAPSKYRKACINFLSLVVAFCILGMAKEAMAALKVGSRGPQVTAIQKSLQLLGYNNVSATGYYDQQTASAVSQFQRSQRLKADGIVGSRTQSALFQIVLQVQPINRGLPSNGNVLPPPPANRNSYIVLLQERLRNSGFYNGPINGVFSSETQQALQPFQQSYGLNANTSILPRNPVQICNPNSNSSSFLPGNASNNIFAIQQRLRQLGLYNGQIDGIFGTETDFALRRFQAQVNIFPDGIPGSDTLRVLFQYSAPPTTPSPQPKKNRYVVIVPGSCETLIKVSQYVKEAYLTESKEGSYVNSGEFANPDVAKSRSYLLRSRGLDARVIYR
ncbi:Peptidoglycan-binding domain 1 protein [Crinalium epipsammum PCC 9333]|uniref:Peptidoglycan-binding domain 1 protein n=1 Tax=Crinalium epipsammum PCC 9333 TaxID=1173022 RepID=K9W1I3_9CYAN|nr:peptidoglycan-binding protein [Crinalium epipsammum]AFZ13592.1 Peptidoglycan-binding domain 1 protein [Crinalium epipsammum PCC 9333]